MASGADGIPTCPGTVPWCEIKMDLSICLSILPAYLSRDLFIYLYLSSSICRSAWVLACYLPPCSVVHLLRIFTDFDLAPFCRISSLSSRVASRGEILL